MFEKILEKYLNDWIKMRWDYTDLSPRWIWFSYDWIYELIKYFKDEKIIVSFVEVFKNYEYFPPDFYYWWNNVSENYHWIELFLNDYKDDNSNLLFILWFNNDDLNKILTDILRNKFKPEISENEKTERIERWWEFIDEK